MGSRGVLLVGVVIAGFVVLSLLFLFSTSFLVERGEEKPSSPPGFGVSSTAPSSGGGSSGLTGVKESAGVDLGVVGELRELNGSCRLAGEVYCKLGYPLAKYYPPPGLGEEFSANLSYAVEAGGKRFYVGYVVYPVVPAWRAVREALSLLRGGNSSVGYSVVEVDFVGGVVEGSRVAKRPYWVVRVAETYKGYRLWPGCCRDVVVYVDGLNGSARIGHRPVYDRPPLSYEPPRAEEVLKLEPRMLVVEALEKLVAATGNSLAEKALRAFEENRFGNVSYEVDLRILKLGPESRNSLTEKPLAKKYVGVYRLYWIIWISLWSEMKRIGIVLDAESLDLASYAFEEYYPPKPWATVVVEPVYSEKPIETSIRIVVDGVKREAKLVLLKAFAVRPGDSGVVILKAQWKTYGGLASLGEKNASIAFRPSSNRYIRVFFTEGEASFKSSVELRANYTVSPEAEPGLHVVVVEYSVTTGYGSKKGLVPLVFYVAGN